MIRVRLATPTDLARWNEYVAASPQATCYHQAGWKTVIEQSFGVRTHYLLAEDDSQSTVLGVLPLALLSSMAFGRFMVSLPYFSYAGICARDREVRGRLFERAVEIARAEGARHLELRHLEPELDGVPAKNSKVSMKLRLPSSPDELWKSFPAKLRSQVRRPQKEGLVAKIAKADGLDDFYRVFAATMRDLGTPVYAKSFFANILREFLESSWICTVNQGETPLASGFLVGFKDTLEIPWAGSLRTHNQVSPNMLLYWTALSFACEKQYRVFDFGRCTPGEGTYRFKEQWGAKPVPLYWHYWLKRGGPLPELNPRNPKYAVAIQLWKRLPLKVTTFIGPSIVKSLP